MSTGRVGGSSSLVLYPLNKYLSRICIHIRRVSVMRVSVMRVSVMRVSVMRVSVMRVSVMRVSVMRVSVFFFSYPRVFTGIRGYLQQYFKK